MISYVFPGQGAQFEGMGLDMYESSDVAKEYFHKANEILGFDIAEIMFRGSAEDLKQTKVTQMSFEDGLKLVAARAMAMQEACDAEPGTMAAILGLEDEQVEKICSDIDDIVVAANYNCPGQLVISGSKSGIDNAIEAATAAGARRALLLPVGGAFHSPLMAPAKEKLEAAIKATDIKRPICPIYQNVTAAPTQDKDVIKINLAAQLTGPVKWTQTMQNMIADGMTKYVEVGGNGKVLTGLIKKIDRKFETDKL